MDAILEAAAQILEAHGPERATTNLIAQRAGVSIGTLYQYFPNKEALFLQLGRAFVEELGTSVEDSLARLASGPLEEAVPRFMLALGQVHRSSPRLRSILFQQPGSQALMIESNARIERAVAAVLAARPELGDRDPELIAQVLTRAVDGVMRDTILREPEKAEDPRLLLELTRLVMGYLRMS